MSEISGRGRFREIILEVPILLPITENSAFVTSLPTVVPFPALALCSLRYALPSHDAVIA